MAIEEKDECLEDKQTLEAEVSCKINRTGPILHGGNKGGCLHAPGHCLGALSLS